MFYRNNHSNEIFVFAAMLLQLQFIFVAIAHTYTMKLFYLLLAAAFPSLAVASVEYFTSVMNGAQSGCYKSEALGNAVATLSGSRFCINLSYIGLSSPELYSHIHGPATVGISNTADVLYTLSTGAVKTPAKGDCFQITESEKKDLMKGLWYFNVHTKQCPNGEIRGQIFPVAM
ncbi:hypothetical protein MPSEU_000066100 [Mayamaea pseudoterrestris]|nr:hypothetical protein MPSEU_000066100 [Mayamaea pseudoterrestris]